MKIILSRKGFDSSSGKYCNPILPDGTLLSLPIPSESKNPVYYKDLSYEVIDFHKDFHKVMTYDDILSDLSNGRWERGQQCHLDPDLREGIKERESDWTVAFGQSNRAKEFLDRMNIEVGDLFLFFGRFRQTEITKDGKLGYKHNFPEQHIIYGYMQVGEIIANNEIDKYYRWHPHADNGKDNNLYLPMEKLTLNQNMPGYGLLDYNFRRVLTKYGMKLSMWNLPDFLRGIDIRVDTASEPLLNKFHDAPDGQNYFQFTGRGQEFVMTANKEDKFYTFYQKSLEEWAYRMLIDEAWDDTLSRLREEKLDYDFGNIDKVRNEPRAIITVDEFGQCNPDYMENNGYCHYYHRITPISFERCDYCPLCIGSAQGMGVECLYKIPVSNGQGIEIPCNTRDRYAFYEILIQKGVLQK